MDIKGIIEWLATDSATTLITIFPYLLVGVVGLYLLWMVIGYLRVSQVGIEPQVSSGSPALPLQTSSEGVVQVPRGVPYCPNDHLQFPVGARFGPRCEADLLVECRTCGATVRAADDACYRCGTRINEPIAAAH
jgi:hypothetical protein